MQKILLLLILFSTSTYSQNNFKGWWESKTSKYITIIYVGDYGVSQVINYNPFNENVIEERIIKRNKNTFVTHLFNKSNGYSVKIKYKLKDKNNLICKFTGDLKRTVHLTRYKFDLNNKLKT